MTVPEIEPPVFSAALIEATVEPAVTDTGLAEASEDSSLYHWVR